MTGRRTSRRLWCIVPLVVMLASPVQGQFVSAVPMLNFRLPMFNDAGFKTWELKGSEGLYLNENRIEIISLELNVFSGTEAGLLEIKITSPLAIVQPAERLVSGPRVLRVNGEGYELFGEDWTYDDRKKTLVVRQSVVLTFESGIGDILK